MMRIVTAVAAVALLAAACGAPSQPATEDDNDASGAAEPEAEPVAPDTAVGVSSAAPGEPREPIRASSHGCEPGEFYWTQSGCQPAHSIPLDGIISGGPPPDGIPPIDAPRYETIAEAATWLDDTSPVLVVDIDDDVRAYPLAILTWHEIVNDTVGGVPVVVTYCPLCNSALVFERRVDGPDGTGLLLDFGTSGRLYLSNLVMYDRQTRNLWTQFEGEGVVGEEFLGTRLQRRPAWLFGFAQLAELHPEAQVLSRDTGHSRDYGRNPYVGYDQEDRSPFLFRGELDDRFPPMTRMVGLAGDQDAVAITTEILVTQRAVTTAVDGRDIVVVWAPGQASALDTASIDQGRDVGQTAAFIAQANGDRVELEDSGTGGVFVDAVSGSRFDLRGRALDGPHEGARLEPIPHDDTFWFVWVAFRPGTGVVS